MNKSLIFVFAWLGLCALPACGSSSSDGGSAGSSSNGSGSCFPSSASDKTSAACKSCVESSCSSEYSALCTAGCQTNSSSSACGQAVSNVGACIENQCMSQCAPADTGSGGSANVGSGGAGNPSGGSSSAGAGGAGTPTVPSCVMLESCCNTLPGAAKNACLQSAGYNKDSTCQSLLTQYQTGGLCADSSAGSDFFCYVQDSGICTKTFALADYVDMYKTACTNMGGQTPDACPSDNLLGCCTIGTGTTAYETCYYMGNSDALDADTCAQSTGVWSTTP